MLEGPKLAILSFTAILGYVSFQAFLFWRGQVRARSQLAQKRHQLRRDRDRFHEIIQRKASKMNPSIPWEEIVKKSAHELNRLAREGELKCSEILTAFQLQCCKFEGMNFLAEYIEVADHIAENLDKNKEKFAKSPLYGVPVSLKESLRVEKLDATCGLVKYCNAPSRKNCIVFESLVAMGAMPFITTSMARAGMSHDSSNPVFGEQHNPRYRGFTAGGSSGGEGIALSVDASPLGVGTDIGGSVRFPPAFNGVCGLNPTRGRISRKGMFSPGKIPRFDLTITIGPMARFVDDLVVFFRTFLTEQVLEMDPSLVPLPFSEANFTKTGPLKMGYFVSFKGENVTLTVPSVQRAIKESAEMLKRAGHEVTEIELPDPVEGFRLVLASMLHDAGLELCEALADEPLPAKKHMNMLLLRAPTFLRAFATGLFLKQFGKQAEPMKRSILGIHSSEEAATLIAEIQAYRFKVIKATSDFDVILCPLFAVPVPKKTEDDMYLNLSSIYSILWNLLDFPAGIVCTSRVTEEDNQFAMSKAAELRAAGDKFNEHLHRNQTETKLPLCVQVVGRPFQEETVLRVMQLIEQGSRFDRYEVPIRKDFHLP